MINLKKEDISLIWSSERYSLKKKITYYNKLKIDNISSEKEYEYFLETYFWDLNFFFMKFNSILLKFVYLSEKKKKKYLNIKTDSVNLSKILNKYKDQDYLSLIHSIIGEDGIGPKQSSTCKQILYDNSFFHLFKYIINELPLKRRKFYMNKYYSFFMIYETLIRNLSSHGYLKSLFQLNSVYYSNYFNQLLFENNIHKNSFICFKEQQFVLQENDNFLHIHANGEHIVNLIESSRFRKLLNIIYFNNEINFQNQNSRGVYFTNRTNKFPKLIIYNCDSYFSKIKTYPLSLTFYNIQNELSKNKRKFLTEKIKHRILSYFQDYSYDHISKNTYLINYLSSLTLPFSLANFNDCIDLIRNENLKSIEFVFVNFFMNYFNEPYKNLTEIFLKKFLNNVINFESLKSILVSDKKNRESLLKQFFKNNFNGYFLGSRFDNFIPTNIMYFKQPQRTTSSYINIFSSFNMISSFVKNLKSDLKV